MKKIVAVHLLNDFSGSPLVFREALKTLCNQGFPVDLHTATPDGDGFLSNIDGINMQSFAYKRSENKLITLWFFLKAQWMLFFKLYKRLSKEDIVYINTLLPFGAALAGWMKGCDVVYHVHEVSVTPALLKGFLKKVAATTATRVLFVSQFVADQFSFPKAVQAVVYNALPEQFNRAAESITMPNMTAPFTVLMICSLKAYKGVYSFVQLAKMLPGIRFQLVLNATAAAVEAFRKETECPANCEMFCAQKNTVPFYKQAHVVLNLSHPEKWVETFGLTILEGMAFGRPVIVPTVGGPIELVTHGKEGFLINGNEINEVAQGIQMLQSDLKTYIRFSENARQKAATFSAERFSEGISTFFGAFQPELLQPVSGKIFQNLEHVA